MLLKQLIMDMYLICLHACNYVMVNTFHVLDFFFNVDETVLVGHFNDLEVESQKHKNP